MKEKQSLIRLNRNSCRNREMSRSREKNLFLCFLTKIKKKNQQKQQHIVVFF